MSPFMVDLHGFGSLANNLVGTGLEEGLLVLNYLHFPYTAPKKFNIALEKNDGWKTILSLWVLANVHGRTIKTSRE